MFQNKWLPQMIRKYESDLRTYKLFPKKTNQNILTYQNTLINHLNQKPSENKCCTGFEFNKKNMKFGFNKNFFTAFNKHNNHVPGTLITNSSVFNPFSTQNSHFLMFYEYDRIIQNNIFNKNNMFTKIFIPDYAIIFRDNNIFKTNLLLLENEPFQNIQYIYDADAKLFTNIFEDMLTASSGNERAIYMGSFI